MKAILRTVIAATLIAGAAPAIAAEVQYPAGSLLGLAPPAGLEALPGLQGFGNQDQEVLLVIQPLPPAAFAELEKSLNAANLKKEGIALETRETFAVPFGKAFAVVGQQTGKGKTVRKWVMVASGADQAALVTVQIPAEAMKSYPDKAVRAALATLTARERVPDEEALSLLPFTAGDLAAFKVAAVLPRRAVLLSDAGADMTDSVKAAAAHIVISLGTDAPDAAERDAFARRAFSGVSNMKDIRIVSSEPLRLGGQMGHQILAEARDAKTNDELKVVQWLRFGGNAHLQMIGTARANDWEQAFPRFRAVRDGVDVR